MKEVKNSELVQIDGGFQLKGVILQYGVKAFNFIYDLGRSLGSSIRRIGSGKYCQIN